MPTGPYQKNTPPYPPSNIFLFHNFLACFVLPVFAIFSPSHRLADAATSAPRVVRSAAKG
jgi:hypothetical protein